MDSSIKYFIEKSLKYFDNKLPSDKKWKSIEDLLVESHFFLLLPFINNRSINQGLNENLKRAKISIPKIKSNIDLVALNWRGLYQINGRHTLLAPSGRTIRYSRSINWHKSLHREYLESLGKHLSINQLFLEWEIYKNGKKKLPDFLSVNYFDHKSIVKFENEWVKISISDSLSKKIFEKELILNILRNHTDHKNYEKKKSERNNSKCKKFFTKLQLYFDIKVDTITEYILFKEPKFFEDFHKLYFKEKNIEYSIKEFRIFVKSLIWLSFFCNSEFAGNNFYTARLPNLFRNKELKYPSSSFSLVSHKKDDEILNAVSGFTVNIKKIYRSNVFVTHINRSYKEWLNLKMKPIESGNNLNFNDVNFWSKIKNNKNKGTFPLDYNKIAFLCHLSKELSEYSHEGDTQRFTFLIGFSFEKVQSLLERAVEPQSTSIKWPEKPQNTKLLMNDVQSVAKWIESHSLLFQRWENAIFFDTSDEDKNYVRPTQLIKIRRLIPEVLNLSKKFEWIGHPTNEYELKKSLEKITNEFKGMAGMFISNKGSILYLGGISMPFKYSNEIKNNSEKENEKEKSIFAWNERNNNFNKVLDKKLKIIANVNGKKAKNTKENILKLIEAIATLGHGATLVIRAGKINKPPYLPPLNGPVWKLTHSQTIDEFSKDILSFALAASLDGATEIVFNKISQENLISFRRYIKTIYTPWEQKKGEEIFPDINYTPRGISWSELLTLGTRHRSALAMSLKEKKIKDYIIITISSGGPVRIWESGNVIAKANFRL